MDHTGGGTQGPRNLATDNMIKVANFTNTIEVIKVSKNEDQPTQVRRRLADNVKAHIKGNAHFIPGRGYQITYNRHQEDNTTLTETEDVELIFSRATGKTHWYHLRESNGHWWTLQEGKLEHQYTVQIRLGNPELSTPARESSPEPQTAIDVDPPAPVEEFLSGALHHVTTLQGSQPLNTETQEPTITTQIAHAASEGTQIPVNMTPVLGMASINIATVGGSGGAGGGGGPPLNTGNTNTTGQGGGGRLEGQPPRTFTGEREDSNDFLIAFKGYCLLNLNHPTMVDKHQRVALALTFIDRKLVNSWKNQEMDKLQNRISSGITSTWAPFEKSFKEAFTNLAQKQTAYQKLKTCKQDGRGLNIFLAEFRKLLGEADIPETDREAMSLLMANLNPSLVVSIINRDDSDPRNPPSFERFIKNAQDSYVKWIAKQPFQNKRFGPTQQRMWNATFGRNRANNNGAGQHHTTSQG